MLLKETHEAPHRFHGPRVTAARPKAQGERCDGGIRPMVGRNENEIGYVDAVSFDFAASARKRERFRVTRSIA